MLFDLLDAILSSLPIASPDLSVLTRKWLAIVAGGSEDGKTQAPMKGQRNGVAALP